MFIKNYADTDLVINYRGNSLTLESKDVTYVDDAWISLAMVKAMFGNYVSEVDQDTPIEEFLFDNQKIIDLDTVYLTRIIGPSDARIFIKGGKVSIYFSDGKDIPTSASDMSLFTDFTNVDGLLTLKALPKWTLVKSTSGTPVVTFTDIEALTEEE